MRRRTLAVALGALLATTAFAAAPALAQTDSYSTYSYTTTYPGTTTYTYTAPPTGLGGVGVYVRPGPYVPPPATPDPSFVPQVVPPSTAYVPPGSISKGEAIAKTGGGKTSACISCHGPDLKGMGPMPPLAGRSAPSSCGRCISWGRTGKAR